MPQPDQLTRTERLRLEAFNQAIASTASVPRIFSLDELFARAERIADFLSAKNPS